MEQWNRRGFAFISVLAIGSAVGVVGCASPTKGHGDASDARHVGVATSRVDTSDLIGTWYLSSNGFKVQATISRGFLGFGYIGTLVNESGGYEALDNITWNSGARLLEFRRNGAGFWQWYRGKIVEGVFVGRFSHDGGSAARPALTSYAYHATGWSSTYLDRDIVPRVWEIFANSNYRVRLRVDRAADGTYVGRFKTYSTLGAGSAGEEPEYDVEVTQWDGRNLKFTRRDPSWTQQYTGVANGRTISGTFTHAGVGAYPWGGTRAEALTYGIVPKAAADRAAWQNRTRAQLYHLMMAGNPAPLTRSTTVLGSGLAPLGGALPPDRDDDPNSWPQAYLRTELRFDYTLPNPYGGFPISRTSHAHLAVPTTDPDPITGKYPAVLAVNGHGGSAWKMMSPSDGYFWHGDSFARRGYVVLAVDISHRDYGDDPGHGNVAHPAIQAAGFDTDWEQDGERAWDAMRALDYLVSLPYVDASKVVVNGISMGGEITTITGALDTRLAVSVPTGFSPDLGVMIYNGNHPCWQWTRADTREYVDASDFYALTAPRPLIIETGKADYTFSRFAPPFAADKQVARRARAAYGDDSDSVTHYLHYDEHHFHVGDVNPTRVTEQGVRIPTVIEPVTPWSLAWQSDATTTTDGSTLFDLVGGALGI